MIRVTSSQANPPGVRWPVPKQERFPFRLEILWRIRKKLAIPGPIASQKGPETGNSRTSAWAQARLVNFEIAYGRAHPAQGSDWPATRRCRGFPAPPVCDAGKRGRASRGRKPYALRVYAKEVFCGSHPKRRESHHIQRGGRLGKLVISKSLSSAEGQKPFSFRIVACERIPGRSSSWSVETQPPADGARS